MSTDTTAQPAASSQPVPVVDLLQQQLALPFAGLTPQDDPGVPDSLPDGPWRASDPCSLKAALARLPHAVEIDLKTVNPFVDDDGAIDLEAIRAINGLDIGGSLMGLALAFATLAGISIVLGYVYDRTENLMVSFGVDAAYNLVIGGLALAIRL